MLTLLLSGHSKLGFATYVSWLMWGWGVEISPQQSWLLWHPACWPAQAQWPVEAPHGPGSCAAPVLLLPASHGLSNQRLVWRTVNTRERERDGHSVARTTGGGGKARGQWATEWREVNKACDKPQCWYSMCSRLPSMTLGHQGPTLWSGYSSTQLPQHWIRWLVMCAPLHSSGTGTGWLFSRHCPVQQARFCVLQEKSF